MGRVATKDTFGLEQTGPDTEVRRRIVAGQQVPDHYYGIEDEGSVKDFDTGAPVVGGDYQRVPGHEDAAPTTEIVKDLGAGQRNRPEDNEAEAVTGQARGKAAEKAQNRK